MFAVNTQFWHVEIISPTCDLCCNTSLKHDIKKRQSTDFPFFLSAHVVTRTCYHQGHSTISKSLHFVRVQMITIGLSIQSLQQEDKGSLLMLSLHLSFTTLNSLCQLQVDQKGYIVSRKVEKLPRRKCLHCDVWYNVDRSTWLKKTDMETWNIHFWPFVCESPHYKKIAAVKAKRLFPVVTLIPEYLNKKSTYRAIRGDSFGLEWYR